ncbi:MAG: HpcH/HpaI aldolase/citrate lyase family protein [Dehalococcoidia bacterium]
MKPLRSLLFVPAIHPQRMEKAPQYGPDALILDLEDTVPAAEKVPARENVARYLQGGPSLPIYVRIDGEGTPFMEDDVRAVVWPGLAGLVLPKVETTDFVQEVDRLVSDLEAERGLPAGSVEFVLFIETALGVLHCYDLAKASPRVVATTVAGADDGDLVRDLECTWTLEGTELLYARSKILLDSRAAGIAYILEGVFADLQDDEGLEQETQRSKRLGYTGRPAIHPRQVPIINRVFTPTEEEVQYYRGLLEAFAAAEKAGQGVLQFQGKMIDYAMVKRAERILERAQALGL